MYSAKSELDLMEMDEDEDKDNYENWTLLPLPSVSDDTPNATIFPPHSTTTSTTPKKSDFL
jgi:hypothetical protein